MNLTKNNFLINLKRLLSVLILFNFATLFGDISLQADENFPLNDLEMGNTTKTEGEDGLDLPSNPFEIVEMLRRANMMNDATNPSDAIDEALESFEIIENNESL